METKKKIIIAKLVATLFVAAIIFSIVYSIFIKEDGFYKNYKRVKVYEKAKEARQDAADDLKRQEYRARLPKIGDRVILNGQNVSVIKEYFWTHKFKVRYDNGNMSDVAEIEMLDLEKVKPNTE